jgi:hypothetical protein
MRCSFIYLKKKPIIHGAHALSRPIRPDRPRSGLRSGFEDAGFEASLRVALKITGMFQFKNLFPYVYIYVHNIYSHFISY